MGQLLCLAVAAQLLLGAEPGSTADVIGTYTLAAEALERAHSTCDACEPGWAKRSLCVRQQEEKLVAACVVGGPALRVSQTGHGFALESDCVDGAATRWDFTRSSMDGKFKGVRLSQSGAGCAGGKVEAVKCVCTYSLEAVKMSDTIGE